MNQKKQSTNVNRLSAPSESRDALTPAPSQKEREKGDEETAVGGLRVWRPTARDLEEAKGRVVPDVIAPGLKVLFCGINPGLYTAAVGHHFGRPGNRFWPAMYAGGFTPRVYSPFEDGKLLKLGYGITNVVERATARAEELTGEELVAGGERVREKVRRYRPRVLAVVGVGAYRVAFADKRAKLGLQPGTIGETAVWVLPNPSGLNAHYRGEELGRMFRELREAVERMG